MMNTVFQMVNIFSFIMNNSETFKIQSSYAHKLNSTILIRLYNLQHSFLINPLST